MGTEHLRDSDQKEEARIPPVSSSKEQESQVNDRAGEEASSRLCTCTLAGGCFWCTEAVFKRLRGVIAVKSGYADSQVANPSYQQVCTGKTGAAESVQITYDPALVSYETLLDVFWNTHDPTTLNRQGNDHGTQYRSAIYYHNDEQKQAALASKEALEKAGTYRNPVVTEITAFTNFYPAEEYHDDYYDTNRFQGYCMVIIDPKIKKLLKTYGSELKEEYQHQ